MSNPNSETMATDTSAVSRDAEGQQRLNRSRVSSEAGQPVTVLVTAIGGGGHGEQILKALRLASPGRYRIVGADMNPKSAQFSLCDESVVLPAASDPTYMDRLLESCRRLSVHALFHGCEPELKVFSDNRDAITGEGILLPINPRSTIDLCMDKEATMRFLAERGFDPPRYWAIDSSQDLEQIDVFPVVLKPSVGGGGSANVHIAQNARELQLYAELLRLNEPGVRFVIQEYVGRPDSEFTVGVLHDLDGQLLNSIALRREIKSMLNIRIREPNRTGRVDLGSSLVISSGISHGEVGRFPEVTGPCEAIAAAIGARGPVNIQCRLVDGKVKVFEINPRFSGTTSIRAMMGYNEPDLLIRRHVFGETIEPRFAYDCGMVIRTLSETVIERNHG